MKAVTDLNFEKPFFWSEQFLSLQDSNLNLAEIEVDADLNQVLFPYKINGNTVVSPGIGTFGGLYPGQVVDDWSPTWNCLFREFQAYPSMEIVFPPEYFHRDVFLKQQEDLINLCSPKTVWETNQHVPLDGDVISLLSKGNQKKLRQFRKAGGDTRIGTNQDLLAAVTLLEKSRERLGVVLSMSRNQISNAFLKSPDHYSLYIAEIKGVIAASAIVVKLDKENIYVLYWGDDADNWRHLSPVVALFVSIYEDSAKAGFKILDLGTSSVSGVINEGLARFKGNLGAIKTRKLKVAITL